MNEYARTVRQPPLPPIEGWLTGKQIEQMVEGGYIDFDEIPGWPTAEERYIRGGKVVLVCVGERIQELYRSVFCKEG